MGRRLGGGPENPRELPLIRAAPIVAAILAASAVSAGTSLEESLARVDTVASEFFDAAIKFDCKESIVWDGGSASYNYIYIRENGKTQDFRSYSGLSARDPMTPVLPEDNGVPRYLRSAFLWFQIFRQTRWQHHRYSLAGETTVLERPAFGIRFEPVPPFRSGVNDWFGTAWFDAETAQLLRVVAHTPDAWARKLDMEQALREAPSLPAYRRVLFDVETITTEFGVELRGLRLPSNVHVETVEYEVRGSYPKPSRERTIGQTWQRYKKYRFFSTDAEEHVAPVPHP